MDKHFNPGDTSITPWNYSQYTWKPSVYTQQCIAWQGHHQEELPGNVISDAPGKPGNGLPATNLLTLACEV